MKWNTLVSMTLLLGLILISCKDESCLNVTYKDQSIEPISFTFETWENATAVFFIDSLGQLHRYDLQEDVNINRPEFRKDSCENE